MTTTSKSKTFRPRTVRTSGNAPAERHEALRRTPSLGFLLPKQINFMATYSKELAQNWINKYNSRNKSILQVGGVLENEHWADIAVAFREATYYFSNQQFYKHEK